MAQKALYILMAVGPTSLAPVYVFQLFYLVKFTKFVIQIIAIIII